MLRVIVNVRREGEAHGRDLEVPAEIASWELAEKIAEALDCLGSNLDHPTYYRIRAEPIGRQLQINESLADAAVWDGASLILQLAPPLLPNSTGMLFQPAFLISEMGRKYAVMLPEVRLGRRSPDDEGRGGDDALVDLTGEPEGRKVHRDHARLTLKEGAWLLSRSPNATNRTLLNGVSVEFDKLYPVADGDWIELGSVRLQFRLGKPNFRNH